VACLEKKKGEKGIRGGPPVRERDGGGARSQKWHAWQKGGRWSAGFFMPKKKEKVGLLSSRKEGSSNKRVNS